MKINVFFTGCLMVILCLAAGCRTNHMKVVSKDVMLTPRMQIRAKVLKHIVAKCHGFGVYIDEASRTVYAKKPEILAARCKMLGITDTYLTVAIERYNADDIYAQQLRQLARCMKQSNIRLWIILDKVSFYAWADKLGKEDDITGNSVQDIVGFVGDRFAERGNVAGILLVVEPEKMNNSNPALPSSLLYSWGKNKYGIGNDNDKIMHYAFTIIRAVRHYAGKTPVILVIPHSLHEDKQAHRLSIGGINDFLAYSKRVIIKDFSSRFKTIRLQAESELKAAKRAHSISICIKMDSDAINGNSYGEAINSKDWAYIMRGFEYLIRKAKVFPAFRGITIYNYAGLERTWEFAD